MKTILSIFSFLFIIACNNSSDTSKTANRISDDSFQVIPIGEGDSFMQYGNDPMTKVRFQQFMGNRDDARSRIEAYLKAASSGYKGYFAGISDGKDGKYLMVADLQPRAAGDASPGSNGSYVLSFFVIPDHFTNPGFLALSQNLTQSSDALIATGVGGELTPHLSLRDGRLVVYKPHSSYEFSKNAPETYVLDFLNNSGNYHTLISSKPAFGWQAADLKSWYLFSDPQVQQFIKSQSFHCPIM